MVKLFNSAKKHDLDFNIRKHNKIAKKYEQLHGEIYNNVEQLRLHDELICAVSKITTSGMVKRALDFGCGAGNLTKHLTSIGCEVIAADVSQGFLDLVSSKTYETQVSTILLNGLNLTNIADESVDMVATYSVLHHIPDYIGILSEFMRVLKPGGVIYIDHEASEEYWIDSPIYNDFKIALNQESKPTFTTNLRKSIGKYFIVANYTNWFMCSFINPRY